MTGSVRPSSNPDEVGTFDRVKTAVDLEAMAAARIVAVGCGGSRQYLGDLARMGLGSFVLVDPDVVSEGNLATQHAWRREIGQLKVDCVAADVSDINPKARVRTIPKHLDDRMTDAAFADLAFGPIGGVATLRDNVVFAAMTDSFEANARLTRLALQYGVPCLSAALYAEGRCLEIVLQIPGGTQACTRCVLADRYAFNALPAENRPVVTSHGTPIFATGALNSVKGTLTLAIVHRNLDHTRWGSMLAEIGQRSLIQVRLDPDLAATGITTFDKVFAGADRDRLYFGETVWSPQRVEDGTHEGYSRCPDCGGGGDLRLVAGTIDDTRVIFAPSEDTTSREAVLPTPAAARRRAMTAYTGTD